MQQLVGTLLLVAPPLHVATPLRVLSSEFPVLPPAPLPVGLRRRVRLGPWAPLRALCDCSWALRCLSFCGSRSLSCSVRPEARGAPLSPMTGPVGAPPPFVRLLVGTLLPVAPPLSVAPLRCVLSFNVAVGPPALPRLRLRCRLSLGSWVLVRLLCAGLWALRCLVLCRSRSLVGSVRRASWLPHCLLLWCSWGSADAYA